MMRRTCLKTSLLALATVSMLGCHQATGPAGGTALSPLSPLPGSSSSSPPRLGPFGGATRVAPPGTGSYGTANNYMGGVAPVGATTSYPAGPLGGQSMVGSVQTHDPSAMSGSGIQPASWNETQSQNSLALSSNDPSPMRPQLNGMRLNDLTQAPPPPGYHTYPAPNGGNTIGQGQPVPQSQSIAVAQPPVQSGSHSVPQDFSATGQPVRSASHESFSNASTNTPNLQPTQSPPALQPIPVANSSIPSTEPRHVAEQSTANSDLPWRSPSPRY